MTEKDIIRRLVTLVEEASAAQREYSRQRNDTNKRFWNARQLTLYEYVEFLHRHGYPPAERPDPPKQNKIF